MSRLSTRHNVCLHILDTVSTKLFGSDRLHDRSKWDGECAKDSIQDFCQPAHDMRETLQGSCTLEIMRTKRVVP